MMLNLTPEDRDDLRKTFETSTGNWYEVALKVADRAVFLLSARASGRVKRDTERLEEEIHRLVNEKGEATREVETLRAKLEACEAILQDAQTEEAMWEAEAQRVRSEAESLRAKVAELGKDLRKASLTASHWQGRAEGYKAERDALESQSARAGAPQTKIAELETRIRHAEGAEERYKNERDAARIEVGALKANVAELEQDVVDWKAAAGQESLDRQAALAQVERLKAALSAEKDAHEREKRERERNWTELRDVRAEVERLKSEKIGWATELERRALDAESRLAAIRERATAPDVCERFRDEGITEGLTWVLEGDAPQEAKQTYQAGRHEPKDEVSTSADPNDVQKWKVKYETEYALRMARQADADSAKEVAIRERDNALACVAELEEQLTAAQSAASWQSSEVAKYRKRAAKWRRRAQKAALDFYEGFLIGHQIGQAIQTKEPSK